MFAELTLTDSRISTSTILIFICPMLLARIPLAKYELTDDDKRDIAARAGISVCIAAPVCALCLLN